MAPVRLTSGFEPNRDSTNFKKDIVWECAIKSGCNIPLSNYLSGKLPVITGTHVDFLLLPATHSVDVQHTFVSSTSSRLALAM